MMSEYCQSRRASDEQERVDSPFFRSFQNKKLSCLLIELYCRATYVQVVVLSAGNLEQLGAQLSSLGLLARINNSLLEGRHSCNIIDIIFFYFEKEDSVRRRSL
jgi:hypothetical protein